MSIVPDGQLSFVGGQDASQSPDRIPQDAYASGINVSTRDGILRPRYGYIKRKLKFPEGGIDYQPGFSRTYENIFHGGKFQALIPYVIGREYYVIVVISGIIFLVHQDDFTVEIIEISDGSHLDELQLRINWSEAGRFLVLYDFPAFPVIIEGKSAKRSDPTKNEVPISVLGAYNQNRLFIANAGSDFTAGDPEGSLATPDAPSTFVEISAGGPYVGQIFKAPSEFNSGPITAMAFLQAVDTGTGIGSLIVGTRKIVSAYDSARERASWEAGKFGSVILKEVGIAGARSFINVNSELFFTAQDGTVRTLSMSRQDQQKWSKVPMSKEVSNWLKYKNNELIPYTIMGYFKNKVFISANAFRVLATRLNGARVIDVAFAGFVVMEMDSISKLGQSQSNPCWAGLWTGVRPLDMCTTGNERCFVMSKDPQSRNELWEIDPDSSIDKDRKTRRQIKSTIYTREFLFQDPFADKENSIFDVALTNLSGEFTLKVDYKPSHSPQYLPWVDWRHVAPTATYTVPEPSQVNGLSPHTVKELSFGCPQDESCNPVTNQLNRWFRKEQLRIKLQGDNWQLHGFRLKAKIYPGSDTDTTCDSYPKVELPREPNMDWDVGDFEEWYSYPEV